MPELPVGRVGAAALPSLLLCHCALKVLRGDLLCLSWGQKVIVPQQKAVTVPSLPSTPSQAGGLSLHHPAPPSQQPWGRGQPGGSPGRLCWLSRTPPRPAAAAAGTGQLIAPSCPASERELRVGAWQEVSIQASSTPCSLGSGDRAGRLGSFCELLRALQEAQCRGRLTVGAELAAEVPVALDLDFTLMDAGCLSLV